MNYGKKHDLPFGIMDVAGLLRLNIRRRAPGQVYVDCPICGDRRGKMNLNTEKDLWRCNYCGEGGGMLSLYSNEMVEKGASKIYALAARHGMRCRRLTWNPNYKGIDDWQLALRRKEQKMKEDPGMTFKEQYLNGLCGLEMLETYTEKWHAMKVDSISLRDYLGLTEQEYDAYLQTDPGVSFQELLDSQRKTQRFRVYQLELEHGETRAFAFGGIDALHKAGFQQPPAAEYTLVYDGELICPVRQDDRDILERIFERYNQAFPPDYRGRSIAPSDVLELYDESERRYFYCDMAGFVQVKFSPALAKKA